MTTETIIIATYVLIFLLISFLVIQHLSDDDKQSKKRRIKTLAEEFEGQKVLIDGKLNEDYSKIKKILKRFNVEMQHKMSTKTGILITGKNPDDFVIEEAKSFGTKIYSEDSFLALCNAPHFKLKSKLRSMQRATVKVKI
ncbi:BRCT domain-containing protein [Zunongwangia endophytica]|uniref:BRCT domain-containing protein n=1 Tax=Zunongwangia endophytica TaxID=1808945 RepID=A0ABV8HFA2_9FLAO|nr:BRCT domain-containing protein [Zunongwangia endophytica]MDN3594072.1 BRCT domain-containing protein [Zunongwangia endophytica]